MVGTTPAINTLATPTQPGSLANEFVPGNVYGSNMFASLDSGVTIGFEMDDFSVKTRGGRSIKPTKKFKRCNGLWLEDVVNVVVVAAVV
ncbi:unnamed protein product, partial [Arabidopsis halleri]